MISEGTIVALILIFALFMLGMKFKKRVLYYVSSVGLMVCSMQMYKELNDSFVLILMIALSLFVIYLSRDVE